MSLIEFENDDGEVIYINPPHVATVTESTKDWSTIVINNGNSMVVRGNVRAVVERINKGT